MHGPTIRKDMIKSAWKDNANWRKRRQSNITKFRGFAWMIIHSRRKNSWRTLRSSITDGLEMLLCGTNGRPDNLWSVNKLARSVTKWTQACDRRLARLISYIHHTSAYRQDCHVGNTARLRRLGLFQDSDFAGDLEDSKCTSSGLPCIFGSRKIVSFSLNV